jgi:diaminohydroxyphosphoribosylaminopyrimidine deaminase/5-amino-6-(5-phosphoribosylamino)uracil reductase
LRVILDRRLRLSPSARVLHEAGRCLVFTRQAEGAAATALRAAGADLETLAGVAAEDEIRQVLTHLGTREINELLVEAGPGLAGAMVAAGVVDELVLYLAPMLLGGAAQSAFAMHELQALQEASRWRIIETQAIGEDLRMLVGAAAGLTLPGS